MSPSINMDEVPDFDAAPYHGSEEAIAAYWTDILKAKDAGLLAASLGDITFAQEPVGRESSPTKLDDSAVRGLLSRFCVTYEG